MAQYSCNLGMVIGPHPLAAAAGLEILRAGGNAFDAVVAAAFTEAVVEPAHNGIGGYGGSAVGFSVGTGMGDAQVVCVDFNTEAPAAATETMFPVEKDEKRVFRLTNGSHKHGALSVGVPGIVDGLDEIHRSWGTLPLRQVMEPAVRAAREGWACNTNTHNALQANAEALRAEFPQTAALLMPGGSVPSTGEPMANPELADTLEQLSVVGLRDFYEGETAVRLVTALERQGGILTLEDLAGYRARHLAPISMPYRGRQLFTPPVGSGGITSFQILQVLEAFDLAQRRPPSPAFFHLFAEAMKACWRRRHLDLGDTGFLPTPERGQLHDGLIEELRAEVRTGLRSPQPGQLLAPDPAFCTSHLCAADVRGNVVSLTQTHGGHFGSWTSVPGTGIILGHGLARFDPRPGLPNSIAPRKRPLHNMAPILATEAGRPVAAYGTPGGRTIVNNQAYFTLALFAYGFDAAATLALPRAHCEEAEPIQLESRAGVATFDWLRSLGHRVTSVEKSGGPAHILRVGPDGASLEGATDPRGEGLVAWE